MPSDPKAADSPLLQSVQVSALERLGGKRARQAIAAIAAIQAMAPAVKWAWEKVSRRDDFSVTIEGADEIYPDLHEWVLQRISASDRKALIASTVIRDRGNATPYVESIGIDTEEAELQLRYDGSRRQKVSIEGHKVDVLVEREDLSGRASLPDNWRQLIEKITFIARTADGRDAVVRMIDGLVTAKHGGPRSPTLFVPSRYGTGWVRRGDLPARTLDSVVLKQGQRERLVADLAHFLGSEDEYNRMSQPWHRGYLFHGAPGTGKTSIARALANHFGLPTYYLPLGDIDKDADLMSFVGQIEPRSVLLLEDVDGFHAATERDEKNDMVSVAAMLNALDGVWTPHGLITIMTTNHRDRLDPALVRAGRIDTDEEFTTLDAEQAQELAERFDVEAPETYIGGSPAEMIKASRALRAGVAA